MRELKGKKKTMNLQGKEKDERIEGKKENYGHVYVISTRN